MVDVIRSFEYKTAGRGKGVLGLKDLQPRSRRPGETTAGGANSAEKPSAGAGRSTTGSASSKSEERDSKRSGVAVVVLYDYTANPGTPGGFPELTVKSGQILELLGEQADNEHWWRVRDEDGRTGCVPASYVLKKEAQTLPWLELAALNSEEAERKERVKRLRQQKEAGEGRGFGPAPKFSKPYVSAYNKSGSVAAPGGKQYYCEVCDKQLNGPKPYQAHMVSKAHKEELALLEN